MTKVLQCSDGGLVWRFHDGMYAPATSDGRKLYVVGYSVIYGLTGGR